MNKFIAIAAVTAFSLFIFACGPGGGQGSAGKTIKSGTVGNNITATISNDDGVLKNGAQLLTLTFSDANGKPIDVGAASLNFFMPAMGSMSAMNSPAALTTTATPGVYAAKVGIEMAGEWQAQITYDGPAGKGKAALPVTAQ